MMSFMSTVITSYFPTTNNQLRNSSNPRQHANIHDGRVTVQPVQGRQSSFAAGTSGTRANILRTGGDNSAQGSSKVLNEEELEFLADLGVAEAKAVRMANLSSYGSDVLSKEKNPQFKGFEKEINYLKQTLSEQSKAYELLTKTFNVFKNDSKEKKAKNIDKEIAFEKKVKELDNMDQSASSPVKIEAPRELSKVSVVNTSLKKLKYHLGQFDNVVKKRITPDALTEGEWGFEHTKAVK
ncbi:hypothetical protein Tco_0579035 [Tanacetum coccineum]